MNETEDLLEVEKNRKEIVTSVMTVVCNKQMSNNARYLQVVSILKRFEENFENKSLKTEANLPTMDCYTPQKYDIVLVKTLGGPHYAVVAHVDEEFDTAWVVTITTNEKLQLLAPINESRMLRGYFLMAFSPILRDLRNYKFCGIYDKPKEFDKICKAINNYTRINF